MTTRNSVSGKRIAFVLYDYPLGVSTMLINSIALLSECNDVRVYLDQEQKANQPCDRWLSKLLVPYPNFRKTFLIGSICLAFRALSRIIPRAMKWIPWSVANLDIAVFSKWLRKQDGFLAAEIIVPVECQSLIAVDLSNASRYADIIYYNMELLDWNQNNYLYRHKLALKKMEYEAIKQVSHVMITSPERAKLFASINDFPIDRISALPVVPLRQDRQVRSDFFRKKFGLGEDRLLVLYSGNFQPWAQCIEIIRSMDQWPANAVLIMHTWNKAALASSYYKDMQLAAAGKPVYFSDEYVTYSNLSQALSSADIGLMFYEAIDANFTEILFSSNKMGEYISGDLPVVCSPHPSLASFVHSEGIGVATDFDGLGNAIALVAADILAYRERVSECRRRHFEFEKHFSEAFAAYASHTCQ